MKRTIPLLCGSVVAAGVGLMAAGSVAAAPAAGSLPKGPGSLAGIWTNGTFNNNGTFVPRDGVQRDADGRPAPLQPAAAALLEKRITQAEGGLPFATTKSQCLPAGMPQMMFGPKLPMQILETPGQVTILIEELTNFRIIRLNEKHPVDPDPSFMGNSVGHWEGDTFVVDTIAMTDRTTLDPIGMPHSDQLHVVERIRRTAKDRIDVEVRFDDPGTFTRPWTAKTYFKLAPPDRRIEEYICENNRNRSSGPDGNTGIQPSVNR